MSKKTIEYRFLSFDTDKELSDAVTDLLNESIAVEGGNIYWELYGNPVMVFQGDAVLVGQAMIQVRVMYPPLYPR